MTAQRVDQSMSENDEYLLLIGRFRMTTRQALLVVLIFLLIRLVWMLVS